MNTRVTREGSQSVEKSVTGKKGGPGLPLLSSKFDSYTRPQRPPKIFEFFFGVFLFILSGFILLFSSL
jgi:hypothetical protein